MEEISREKVRAKKLFPNPDLLLTAFSEEVGEVVKAVLDHYSGKGSLDDIRRELIQAGAMIGRLCEEGDPIHKLPAIWPRGKRLLKMPPPILDYYGLGSGE
jgi:hypothetical protein